MPGIVIPFYHVWDVIYAGLGYNTGRTPDFGHIASFAVTSQTLEQGKYRGIIVKFTAIGGLILSMIGQHRITFDLLANSQINAIFASKVITLRYVWIYRSTNF